MAKKANLTYKSKFNYDCTKYRHDDLTAKGKFPDWHIDKGKDRWKENRVTPGQAVSIKALADRYKQGPRKLMRNE